MASKPNHNHINKNAHQLNKIQCKCPTCEKIHVTKVFWTGGNIMPRICCKRCAKSVRATDGFLATKVVRGGLVRGRS